MARSSHCKLDGPIRHPAFLAARVLNEQEATFGKVRQEAGPVRR